MTYRIFPRARIIVADNGQMMFRIRTGGTGRRRRPPLTLQEGRRLAYDAFPTLPWRNIRGIEPIEVHDYFTLEVLGLNITFRYTRFWVEM